MTLALHRIRQVRTGRQIMSEDPRLFGATSLYQQLALQSISLIKVAKHPPLDKQVIRQARRYPKAIFLLKA